MRSSRLALPSPPADVVTLSLPERRRSSETLPGWSCAALSGRFVEISSAGETAAITAAAGLILDAQLLGEPACWIAVGNSIFFPSDFAASGIDLEALPVIRVGDAVSAARVAERLLRSGGFGAVVMDLGRDINMRIPVQSRLAALAKKHHTVVVCLTNKPSELPSLGPLVSLRVEAHVSKTGFNRFSWALHVLKDKRRGQSWQHQEVCRGPDGLC